MNETYITYEEFADRCNKGYTYEGYVIGHGYAFPHVTGGLEYQSEFIVNIPLNMLGPDFLLFPYGMFNVFQYLDTSEEMIKKSYNGQKKEEKINRFFYLHGEITLRIIRLICLDIVIIIQVQIIVFLAKFL